MKHKFDPEIDECEDIDFANNDVYPDLKNEDDDAIADYWLTDDALDILNDVQAKQDREDRRISIAVIVGCIVVVALIALFGFRHLIWS